jgi:hypothetical protein
MKWLVLVVAAATMAVTSAHWPVSPRSEVQLQYRRVGVATYPWTTILVAGKAVDAMVDTGSMGLVLLSSAVDAPNSLPKGASTHATYASGERYEGHLSRVTVLFSKDAKSSVPVMLATRVTCIPSHPHCTAEGADFAHHRIGGLGGFGAVLGIGSGTTSNPFVAAGIKTWIVDVPNNKIVLNPDNRDLDGFIFHRRFPGRVNNISGCLIGASQRICGPTVLDTGSNMIGLATKDSTIYEGIRGAGSYHLTLGDAQTFDFAAAPRLFALGDTDYSAFGTVIVAGTPVIKDLAIAYDPAHDRIGVKPFKTASFSNAAPSEPDSDPETQVNATNALPPQGTLSAPQQLPTAPTDPR